MLTIANQEKILDLVKQTRPLIYHEMEKARVTVKGAADYVTNVDYAVQDFLKGKLEALFPEIPLIAEEKENNDLSPDGTYWILDPIDGTTNLIHHYHLSAVALALYEKGQITFGTVYNPFTEELFYGAKGQGAYLNSERIHVSKTPEFKDAVISYGSSPYEKWRGEKLFSVFYNIFMECADFRRTGSAELDLCYVACGRQHGYIEQNLKPWDYSAGSIILTEAGGIIKGWSEDTLPYLKNADILACAPQFESKLTSFVK